LYFWRLCNYNKRLDRGTDLDDLENSNVVLSCDDSVVGSYSSTFRINSTQNSTGNDVVINCEIFQTYGTLSASLNLPDPLQEHNISLYELFTVNASLDCVGNVGALCGEVYGFSRYSDVEIYGDGSDGELNVTTTNTVINNYTYLEINSSITSNNITVNDASNFFPRREILIIQVQNHSGGIAGNYEFAYILSIDGNVLILENPITNNYYTGAFNQTYATVTQIVSVPHYTEVNINGSMLLLLEWICGRYRCIKSK
jgi:hypothetical protein